MSDWRWLWWIRWRGTAVFLLFFAYTLILTSVSQKSPTVDEPSHLFRGIAYLKTGATHFFWGHPLLASSFNALPLLTEPNLRLPTDSSAWLEGDWAVAGDLFLWQLNENPLRLIFLGRLPTIWLTMLLGAVIYRWGRQLTGKTAALGALTLFVLDPNFLAHGGLITSDIAVTFFMLLAVYGYWLSVTGYSSTLATNPSLFASLFLAGFALGAAAATKFSAAALGPMMGLLVVVVAVKQRSWRSFFHLIIMSGVAFVVVWGVYRFQLRPFPAAAYWEDVQWQLDYFSRPHGAYLLGQYAQTGWWYYFPVTFLVKTPLPTLILLLWAMTRIGRSSFTILSFLLIPPLIYFLISLLTPLNIGYRHLLPMLPFLHLFIAYATGSVRSLTRSPALPFTFFLLLTTLLSWPNYIPFFNWLAGTAETRWRILSDSNIDWGQDLPALAEWQQQTRQPLYLSYFGMAHPTVYGLDFYALPTWEPGPEQTPPHQQLFNPADPAPGFYAISVAHLQGLVLGDAHDTFAWFRDKEPIARIGGSIFVYEVAARGEPVNVAFSGLRPADLAPELFAQLGTNDVQVRWFDSRASLIWPVGSGWLAESKDRPLDSLLLYFAEAEAVFQTPDGFQVLTRPSYPPLIPWTQNIPVGDTAVFLGYDHLYNREGGLEPLPGEVNLVTGWRVLQVTTRPLKIFVHALDEQGQIMGQWDGLDVDPLSWQPGDVFVQLHRFAVPETAVPASFAIGLYDGETLERLADPIVVRLK